jgi:ABC-2 type transport system permease protein
MGKIGLIIRREYVTRVKKKSFIVMTLLGPILFGALFMIPRYLDKVSDNTKHIYIVDQSIIFRDVLHNNGNYRFHTNYAQLDLDIVCKMFKDSDNCFVLFIPYTILDVKDMKIYSKKAPGVNLLTYISTTISGEIQKALVEKNEVDKEMIDKYLKQVNLESITSGGVSNNDVISFIGLAFGALIYIFIFLYSAQIMRGVMEEKTSRIVEVIISSVKPFQLMMGKIIGVALVGLTQFLLWILLSVAVLLPMKEYIASKTSEQALTPQNFKSGMSTNNAETGVVNKFKDAESAEVVAGTISRVNWPLMISCFIFFFLGGYLLYGSLFAAIGSAVDSETDTQQFMLPVSAPLILSFAMVGTIINNPDGIVAFWFSIIPFTAPVVMMIRLPFGVPIWQMLLSMVLLVLGFIFTTWMGAKIYRTGILMYGKKVSWKELVKWLFYKG